MRRYICHAQLIPRGYGVAYKSPARDVTLCLPIPINLIWRWLYTAWLWIRCPPPSWWENEMTKFGDRRSQTLWDRIRELENENHDIRLMLAMAQAREESLRNALAGKILITRAEDKS